MIEWKEFPDNFEEQFSCISKDSPYVTLLKGGYRETVTGGGITRTVWVYYPAHMEYSCRNLVLLIPGDQTVDEFLRLTGWDKIAEENDILLLLTGGSPQPFTDDMENELAFLNALDKARNDRRYMDTQRALTYFAAYGDAADLGHRMLVRYPSRYAAAALAGKVQPDEAYLKITGHLPSNCADIPLCEVPCPIAFASEQSQEELSCVLGYWQKANKTECEPYAQQQALVWMPDMSALESPVDHLPVARVVFLQGSDPFSESFSRALWQKHLSRTCRSTGVMNDDLHPYRTADEWGLTRQEREVDGFTRHWYEYVSPRREILTDGKYPLVVFLHGGSSNGLSGLYSHEWVQVAKERGLILALPTGTMRCMSENMPHPAWNASHDSIHMDDEKFIRMIVVDIAQRYPVDLGRVYINGHSMGSAMTQRVALAMPDLFAAAASNSGVIKGGFMGGVDLPGVREDLKMPVWIQMGEHDVGGGTMENNPHARSTVEYWLKRADISPEQKPGQWRSGRYLNKEWQDSQGVPMVRYTTTLEKPHANSPQDAWMYYDQFFCHFSRDENGQLLYNGKIVEK